MAVNAVLCHATKSASTLPSKEAVSAELRLSSQSRFVLQRGPEHRHCALSRLYFTETTADVLEAATDAGFSKDQVRRAKSRIGAIARRVGFDKDAEWSWGLPGSPFSRWARSEIAR